MVHPGGRPPTYDPEYIMQEIVCWARLPDSLNINAFCVSLRPEIDPKYLKELVDKDEQFSEVYRIVKAYLAARREEANSEKVLSDCAYGKAYHHYDSFVRDSDRDYIKEMKLFDHELEKAMKKYQKELDKDLQSQDAFGVNQKFDAILTQLSERKRNKEESSISSET